MARTASKKRAIDAAVTSAEHDLRSRFAFVAKKRANIWLTAAGVLFVFGMGLAFVALPSVSTVSNESHAGFLLRDGSTYVPASTPATTAYPAPTYYNNTTSATTTTTTATTSTSWWTSFLNLFSKTPTTSTTTDSDTKAVGDENPTTTTTTTTTTSPISGGVGGPVVATSLLTQGGGVDKFATNVEFARFDLNNPTSTVQTVNALVIGCGASASPQRTNGTTAYRPFATNKTFTVRKEGPNGAVWGYAKTFSSGRELAAMFPNSNFNIDMSFRTDCNNGVLVVKPNSSMITTGGATATPLTIPANGRAVLSISADVGDMDPCTTLQLGLLGMAQKAGSPVLASSVMGPLFVVRGTNPFINQTCGSTR
jgi:hypothetical protein